MFQGKVNHFLSKICLYPYRKNQGTLLLSGKGVDIQVPLLACSDPWEGEFLMTAEWGAVFAPRCSPLTQWSWLSSACLGLPLREVRMESSLLLRRSGSAEASVVSTSTASLLVRDGSLSSLPELPWPYSIEKIGVPCIALKGESLAPASFSWNEWRQPPIFLWHLAGVKLLLVTCLGRLPLSLSFP